VSAYSAADWHDFFVAAVGASAALLGLLFVTMAINLEHILKYPHLPGRAGATLTTLLVVLIVCSFGLAPGQSARALGWEIVALTLVAAAHVTWATVRKHRVEDPRSWTVGAVSLLLVPVLVLTGGGVSLVAGSGGGLYWILGGTTLTFVAASINAWVLMVEILR
jgi:hypothetical protein